MLRSMGTTTPHHMYRIETIFYTVSYSRKLIFLSTRFTAANLTIVSLCPPHFSLLPSVNKQSPFPYAFPLYATLNSQLHAAEAFH